MATTIGLKSIEEHASLEAMLEHLDALVDAMQRAAARVSNVRDAIKPSILAGAELTDEEIAEVYEISCLFSRGGTTDLSEELGDVCDPLCTIVSVLNGQLMKIRGDWVGREDAVAMQRNRLTPY